MSNVTFLRLLIKLCAVPKRLGYLVLRVTRGRLLFGFDVMKLHFALWLVISLQVIHKFSVANYTGQSKAEDRNRDFNTIHNGIIFPSFGTLSQHDALFYIGDFNYRINCSNDQVRYAVRRGQLDYLIKNDQLLESRRYGSAFSGFQEGLITFPPTYKYDIGKDVYDTRYSLINIFSNNQ